MNSNPIRLIDSFSGEYFFLSNFYEYEFFFHRRFYPTAEHAFQSMKAANLTDMAWVRRAESAKEAKKRGRQVTLRPDWEFIKLFVMEDIVRSKFLNNKELSNMLKNTGTALLMEGNNWGDQYWGVVNNVGENHLGRLLMKIRWEMGGYAT